MATSTPSAKQANDRYHGLSSDQLVEIYRTIYLSRRLDAVEVVRQAPPARDRVYFSAYVTLSDPEGETRTYRIVGADEIDSDSSKGYISVDSPLARALLGKSIDDEVILQVGDKEHELLVLSIEYR